MLYWLSGILEPVFGPFRLLSSRSFLIVLGLYLGFAVSMYLLPKLMTLLPRDRGREFAAQAEVAKGKPTGAGIIFIPIFIVLALVVVPFSSEILVVLGLTFLTCLGGYLDDSSKFAWGEYIKASLDLVVAICASLTIALTVGTSLWLPFVSTIFIVPTPVFVSIGTVLIWVAINCTNCSDGVDGLSGSLSLIGIVSLGAILYLVLGNASIATYLLLPLVETGANWAILSFTLAGCLSAYLWFNAYPSRVLMGDAGSRALGFIIGTLVLVSGNPFLLLILATVLIVNGGTGLVKVALLRFLKVRIFHNTRFPLHDHVRQTRNWSNAQVLLKFSLIQILIIIGLIGVLFKVR